MKHTNRILIISPNLQPGQCGVSDYTIVLKQYLVEKLKCDVFCLAISDKYVSQPDAGADVARIPFGAPVNEKVSQLKETINTFKPDRVIFHFVSYGYQKLGLPFWLLGITSILNTVQKVDLLIHELWIGGSVYDPLKSRLLGKVQRQLILRFFRRLPGASMVTTSALTAATLRLEHLTATWSSVFNNITEEDDEHDVPLPLRSLMENEQSLKLVMFGSIPPDADAEVVMSFIKKQREVTGLPVVVISLGKLRDAITPWTQLIQQRSEGISFHATGMLPAPAISWVLHRAHAGLSTYPFPLWTKSGAIAALLAHGLQVVIFGDFARKVPEQHMPGKHPAVSFYHDLPANFSLVGSKRHVASAKAYNDEVFFNLCNAIQLPVGRENSFSESHSR